MTILFIWTIARPSWSASRLLRRKPWALILFPSFGFEAAEREVFPSECFVRLTQASTNYVTLGEAGFDALTGLVCGVPARAIDYPDTATAIATVERLWGNLA